MNVYDLFVRHESDVVFLKGSGEEPVEPGHFPPKERHRMQLDLIMDVVERGLKDEGTGALILLAEVGHQVRRDGGAQAVTPHNNLESFKLLWQ